MKLNLSINSEPADLARIRGTSTPDLEQGLSEVEAAIEALMDPAAILQDLRHIRDVMLAELQSRKVDK